MDKLQRNERIALMVKMLADSPGKLFTLGHFSDQFGAAKSTISEDIDIIQGILDRCGTGVVETVPGASGGVRLMPASSSGRTTQVLEGLCRDLSVKDRILPGGYMYMLDIIFNPEKVSEIGQIFAARFADKEIDYVITVETKGIPLAFTTAKFLNVPLVIVRHYSEATDGASVNINYVSGSSKKLQTMVLSMKSLRRNSRLLFIDDFMKGGGTAKGITDLAKEFECQVVGFGVLIETSEPERKLVENYYSLLTLEGVDAENGVIQIKASTAAVE